jgi:hypothetical protein
MIGWGSVRDIDPELWSWASERLLQPPAFLTTVRADGSPRVHPSPQSSPTTACTCSWNQHHRREPTSANVTCSGLHNGVRDNAGTGGEVYVAGRGEIRGNSDVRHAATTAARFQPLDRYILFELLVAEVRCIAHGDVMLPTNRRWTATATA